MFTMMGLFLSLAPQSLRAFDVSDNLGLPLYFLLVFILPAVVQSLGFAVTAVILARHLDGKAIRIRDAVGELRPRAKDLIASALIAGMLILALVVALGLLGALFVALFFGPPILVQVIALEGLDLPSGWARTREMMRGQWARVLMALLTVALGIGLVEGIALGLADSASESLPDVGHAAILVVLGAVLFALGNAYLAAVSFVCYEDSRVRYLDSSK